MDLKQYDIRIKQSLAKCGAVHLRGEITKDADLDFFVSKEAIQDVVDWLVRQEFFIANQGKTKIQLQKIIEGEIIKIDLELSFDYVFKKVPGLCFRQDFLQSYLASPTEFKVDFNAVRYLFMERKHEKYLRYLREHRQEIIKRDSFKRPLDTIPFRTQVSSESIIDRIVGSQSIRVFPFLKLKQQFRYLGHHFRACLAGLGRGKSVAVIGPDGCGKSTLVGFLEKTPQARSGYMGSNDFVFGSFYSSLTKNSPLFLRGARFLAVYFENWLKSGKIWFWKLRGKTVYLDRYPSYQYFLQKKKTKWIFKLFYGSLFPKPDITVILACSEETILSRKDELTAPEIRAIYEAFRQKLNDSKNVYWIQNENLNEAMAEVLDKVRKHAKR